MRFSRKTAVLFVLALLCMGVTIDYYLEGPELGFTETAGDKACAAGDYKLFANSTTATIRACQNGVVSSLGAGGGGEANTASDLGGGLGITNAKVGVDLPFDSFATADFDNAANLFSIDDTKWATDAQVAAGYQPLDTDLTVLAAIAGAQGDVLYRNATQWTRLPAGLAGQVLHTNGPGADPAWDTDDAGGGGGGNALEATLDFGAAGAPTASVVVTGQAWVSGTSKIVCAPTLFASADRVEGEEDAVLEGLVLAAHTRVVATGFTITGSVREGMAFGRFTVHCVGV